MSSPDVRLGHIIVITRAASTGRSLETLAASRGLKLSWRPVITTTIRRGAVSRLRRNLGGHRFDWIAVTSAAAASPLAKAWRQSRWSRSGPRPRIGAVGAVTARRLRACGLPVDLVGRGPGGAALARAMLAASGPGVVRVLWPRVERAHRDLPNALRQQGARVVEAVAYRAVARPGSASTSIGRALEANRLAAVCFSAPSVAAAVIHALPAEARAALRRTPVASLGPATSAALRRWQIDPVVEGAGGDCSSVVRALLFALAPRTGRRAA